MGQQADRNHSTRERSSAKESDSRRFLLLRLLNMKYRKRPWSKEQNWECGTVRGPQVTEPDSSRHFSLQFLLSSRHGSSASEGGAREKLHPQLPCSLVAKLKGKLNLN